MAVFNVTPTLPRAPYVNCTVIDAFNCHSYRMLFQPMPLSRKAEPFNHPDWLFEIKWDGFRSLAYIENDRCRLVSRNGKRVQILPGTKPRSAAGVPSRTRSARWAR
jgi:hypothetical protein